MLNSFSLPSKPLFLHRILLCCHFLGRWLAQVLGEIDVHRNLVRRQTGNKSRVKRTGGRYNHSRRATHGAFQLRDIIFDVLSVSGNREYALAAHPANETAASSVYAFEVGGRGRTNIGARGHAYAAVDESALVKANRRSPEMGLAHITEADALGAETVG